VRDHLRRKKFHFWRQAEATSLDVSEMAFMLPNQESSPEARMLAAERLKQVAKTVQALSANQRRVFVLRFAEDLELQEISRCTGMTLNTVKTHLHRAIHSVRKALGVRL
jgi:RNA polymerase sigma-70 factor (ECF subfamily)